MTLSIRKTPLIFREEELSAKKGLRPIPTVPNYTTTPSEHVEFVCFPYIVSDSVMTQKSQAIRVRSIKKKHPNITGKEALDLLFENIPSQIAIKYRRYLRKVFPTIADKPLIIILVTDRDPPYEVPNDVFCVRTSLCKSDQRTNDIPFPYPLDWEESPGPLPPANASIGFCGIPYNHTRRVELLRFLNLSDHLQTDFLYRKKFFSYLKVTPEKREVLRQEFKIILHRNIFSVCCRGAGNYSVRFYETLRAGRIPVLLDSDMPLPFEDEINWNELIVCKQTPQEVEQTILDWIANRDLVAIQNKCRKIWEEFLYFPTVIERLPSQFCKFFYEDKD